MFTDYFRCVDCKAYFRITTSLTYKDTMEYLVCPHCSGVVDYAIDKQVSSFDEK